MYLEEHTVEDVPQLSIDHPAGWLEKVIKGDILKKKPVHDAEHMAQCAHWGIETNDYTVLTIRERNGKEISDRLWHVMLHLRYWKEKGMHNEIWEKFEDQFDFDLLTLTLPRGAKVE